LFKTHKERVKMKTKAEVYPATEQEGGGYWVCVCIDVGSYYKHMTHNKIHCLTQQSVSETVWKVLTHNVCPECGEIFAQDDWLGLENHWQGHHTEVISYADAWTLIEQGKYVEVMLSSAE